MCGIYGSTIPYTKQQVQQKLERTDFRGPDRLKHIQLKTGNGVLALGHNRLSIIDLDARSDQPFTYLDHIHVVFNGEIYNFRDIKGELQKKDMILRQVVIRRSSVPPIWNTVRIVYIILTGCLLLLFMTKKNNNFLVL